MPVHPVKKKGRIVGWQYGQHGKIYRGKGAKAKAERQGRAIQFRKHSIVD